MITESTIILAIIGMVGLFSSAFVWQRANKITYKYYDTSTNKHADWYLSARLCQGFAYTTAALGFGVASRSHERPLFTVSKRKDALMEEYQIVFKNGDVQYILAENLEEAAWSAYELARTTDSTLKDIIQ